MLVGGVEEEETAFEVSTVMTLLIESEDDARVASSLLGAVGEAPRLSKRGENIVSCCGGICRVEVFVIIMEEGTEWVPGARDWLAQ